MLLLAFLLFLLQPLLLLLLFLLEFFLFFLGSRGENLLDGLWRQWLHCRSCSGIGFASSFPLLVLPTLLLDDLKQTSVFALLLLVLSQRDLFELVLFGELRLIDNSSSLRTRRKWNAST